MLRSFSQQEASDPERYHSAILSLLNGEDSAPLPLSSLLQQQPAEYSPRTRRRTHAAAPQSNSLKRVLYDTSRSAAKAGAPLQRPARGASGRRRPAQREEKRRKRRRSAAEKLTRGPPLEAERLLGFEQTLKEHIIDLRTQRAGGKAATQTSSSALPIERVAALFERPASGDSSSAATMRRRTRPSRKTAPQPLLARRALAPRPTLPASTLGGARPGLPALVAYPTAARTSSSSSTKALEMLTPQQKRRVAQRSGARKASPSKRRAERAAAASLAAAATAATAAPTTKSMQFEQFETQLARSIAAERRAHASSERALDNAVSTIRSALSLTNRAIDQAAVRTAASVLGGSSGFVRRWKVRKETSAFEIWKTWTVAKRIFDNAPALRRAEAARVAAEEERLRRWNAASTKVAKWYSHWHALISWSSVSGSLVQNKAARLVQRRVRGQLARRSSRSRARVGLLRQLKRLGNGQLSQVRQLCDADSSASVGTSHVAEPRWRRGLDLVLREVTAAPGGSLLFPLREDADDATEEESAARRRKLYRAFIARFGPPRLRHPHHRRTKKGRRVRSRSPRGGSPRAASPKQAPKQISRSERDEQKLVLRWGWGFGREYACAAEWIAELAEEIKRSYATEKLERRAAHVAAAASALEEKLLREQRSLDEHMAAAAAREAAEKAVMDNHKARMQRDIERRNARRERQAELLAAQKAEREKNLESRKLEWAARELGDKMRTQSILEVQEERIKLDVKAQHAVVAAQQEREAAFVKKLEEDQRRLEGQVRAHRFLKKEAKHRWERKYLERKRELHIEVRARDRMMAMAKEEAVKQRDLNERTKALNKAADQYESLAKLTRYEEKRKARHTAKAEAEAERAAKLEWSKSAYLTWEERDSLRKAEDERLAAEYERTRWITGVTLFRGLISLGTVGYVDAAAALDLGSGGARIGDLLAAGDRDRKKRLAELDEEKMEIEDVEAEPDTTRSAVDAFTREATSSTALTVATPSRATTTSTSMALTLATEPSAPRGPRPGLLVRVVQKGAWLYVTVYATPFTAVASESSESTAERAGHPLGAQLLMRGQRSVQGFPRPNDTWGVMCSLRTEAALVVRQMLRVAAMGACVEAAAAVLSMSQTRQKAAAPVARAELAAQNAANVADLLCLHAHAAITSAYALKAAAAAEVSAIGAVGAIAASVAEAMRSRAWERAHRAALTRVELHRDASKSSWTMVHEFMSERSRRLKVRGQRGWFVCNIDADSVPIVDPELPPPLDDDGAVEDSSDDLSRRAIGRDTFYYHEDDDAGEKLHYQWEDPRRAGRAVTAAERGHTELNQLRAIEENSVAEWIAALDRSARRPPSHVDGDGGEVQRPATAGDEYPHAVRARHSAELGVQAVLRSRVQYRWKRKGVLVPCIRGAGKTVEFAVAKKEGTKKSRRLKAQRAGNVRLTAKHACQVSVKYAKFAEKCAVDAWNAVRRMAGDIAVGAATSASDAVQSEVAQAEKMLAEACACLAASEACSASLVAMRVARTVAGPTREFRGMWLLSIDNPWCSPESLSPIQLRVVRWSNAQMIQVWLASPTPILMLKDMHFVADGEHEWPLHEGASSHEAETKEYVTMLLDHHAAATEYAVHSAMQAAAAANFSARDATVEMALIAASASAAAAEFNAWSALSCVLVAPVEHARRLKWDQGHDAQRQKIRETNSMREAHWGKLIKRARAVMPPRPPTPLAPNDARLLLAVASAEAASSAAAVAAFQSTLGVASLAALGAARAAAAIAGRLKNEIETLLNPESTSIESSSTWEDSSEESFIGVVPPPSGPPPRVASNPNEAPGRGGAAALTAGGGVGASSSDGSSDDSSDELEEEVDLPPMGWIKYIMEQKLWIIEPETGARAQVVPDERSGKLLSGKTRSSRRAREKAARMVQKRFRGIIARRRAGAGSVSFDAERRAEEIRRSWMRPRAIAGCEFFLRQEDGHCQWEDPRDAGIVPSSSAELAMKLVQIEDIEIARRTEWNWNIMHFIPLNSDRLHEFGAEVGDEEEGDGSGGGGDAEITVAHSGNLDETAHLEARLHALLKKHRAHGRSSVVNEVSGVPRQFSSKIYSRGLFGVARVGFAVQARLSAQLRSEENIAAGAAVCEAERVWKRMEWIKRCEEALAARTVALVSPDDANEGYDPDAIKTLFKGCFRLRIDSSRDAKSTAWTCPQSRESENFIVASSNAADRDDTPSIPRRGTSGLGVDTIDGMHTTDLISVLRRYDVEYDDCISESDLRARVYEVAALDAGVVAVAGAMAAAHVADSAATVAEGIAYHAQQDVLVSVTLRIVEFDGGLKAYVRVLPRTSPPPFTWTADGHTGHLEDMAHSSMAAEMLLLHRQVRVAVPLEQMVEDEDALKDSSDDTESDDDDDDAPLAALSSHHSVHEASLDVRYLPGVIVEYDPRHFETDNDGMRVRLPYLIKFDGNLAPNRWASLPSEEIRVAPNEYGVQIGSDVDLYGAFQVTEYCIGDTLWLSQSTGSQRIADARRLASELVSRAAGASLSAVSIAMRAVKHATWVAKNAEKAAKAAEISVRRNGGPAVGGGAEDRLVDEAQLKEDDERRMCTMRDEARAHTNKMRYLSFVTGLAIEVSATATAEADRNLESALVAVDRCFIAQVSTAAVEAANAAYNAVNGPVNDIVRTTEKMYIDARNLACKNALLCSVMSATVSSFQASDCAMQIGVVTALAAATAADVAASFAEQEALAAQRAKEFAARWELLRSMDWGRFRREYVSALALLDYKGWERQKGWWTLARRLLFESKAWGHNGIGSKRRLRRMKEDEDAAKGGKTGAAAAGGAGGGGMISGMMKGKKKKPKKKQKLDKAQRRRVESLEVDPSALLRLGMWLSHPKRGPAAAPAALVVLRRAVDVCDLLQDLAVSAENIEKDSARAKSAAALAAKKKAQDKAAKKKKAREMLARKGIRPPRSRSPEGRRRKGGNKEKRQQKKKGKRKKKGGGKKGAASVAPAKPQHDMMAGVARRANVLVTLARLEEKVALEKCKRRGGGGIPDYSQSHRRWQEAMKHAENVVQPQLWLEAAVVYEAGGNYSGALAVYGSVVSNFTTWSGLGTVVLRAAGAMCRNDDWKNAAQYLSHPSLLDNPPAPLTEADAFLLAAHAREIIGDTSLAKQGLKEAIGAAISAVPVHRRNDDTIDAARRSADSRLPSTWWKLAHKCDAAGGSLLAATILERAMQVERRARRAHEAHQAEEEEERQRRRAHLSDSSEEEESTSGTDEDDGFGEDDEAVEEGFELFGLAVVSANEWAWRAKVLHSSRTAYQLRVGAAALLQAVAVKESDRDAYGYGSDDDEEEDSIASMTMTAEVWNLESTFYGESKIGAACPAALTLQTILRGRWSRRAAHALMKRVRETRAARVMQRAWRYRAAKLHIIAARKLWKELEAAAIPLQRRWRHKLKRRVRRRRVRGFEAVVCVGPGLFHDGTEVTTKTSHLKKFEKEWTCAVCAKVNVPGCQACDVCGRSKPVRTSMKKKVASPPAKGGRRGRGKGKRKRQESPKAKAKLQPSSRVGSTLATLRVVSATTDELGLPIPNAERGPRITLFAPHRTGAQFLVEAGWDRRLSMWLAENPRPRGINESSDLLATLGAAAADAAERDNARQQRIDDQKLREKRRKERAAAKGGADAVSDNAVAHAATTFAFDLS